MLRVALILRSGCFGRLRAVNMHKMCMLAGRLACTQVNGKHTAHHRSGTAVLCIMKFTITADGCHGPIALLLAHSSLHSEL